MTKPRKPQAKRKPRPDLEQEAREFARKHTGYFQREDRIELLADLRRPGRGAGEGTLREDCRSV